MHATIRIALAGLIVSVGGRFHTAVAAALQPGDIVVTTEFSSTDFGLMVIDPVTGNRTILSDNTHGIGPNFTSPGGVTLLPNGDLLVGDGNSFTSLRQSRLIEVDPATGNRTILSGSGIGTGPDFQDLLGGLPYGNSIVAFDQQSQGTLFGVDPITGNRTIISGNGVGSGPGFSSSGAVIVGTSAVVAFNGANQLLSIDLTTGDRTILSGPTVGTGPNFRAPNDVILGADGSLIADDISAIYRVDPITGNRTILSSSTVGSGPIWSIGNPYGITTDANGTIVMAAVASGAIYTIDPITGNRTILSDSTHGTGVSFLSVADPVVIPNVPEPSTIVLAALGGLALLVLRRRR
ncbi:MAG TPA: PEP-CTERM sorting domain-containing protein [Pirellulales bacterium]|jgi:sugar lactone lactonase YvrE